jgi:hypothetical protein
MSETYILSDNGRCLMFLEQCLRREHNRRGFIFSPILPSFGPASRILFPAQDKSCKPSMAFVDVNTKQVYHVCILKENKSII